MALQSSGTIGMLDIAGEYQVPTTEPISLLGLSVLAGIPESPCAISEFYGKSYATDTTYILQLTNIKILGPCDPGVYGAFDLYLGNQTSRYAYSNDGGTTKEYIGDLYIYQWTGNVVNDEYEYYEYYISPFDPLLLQTMEYLGTVLSTCMPYLSSPTSPPPPTSPLITNQGVLGNSNKTQYIVATTPQGGMWSKYFTPTNLLIKNQLPGVQVPSIYYNSGATTTQLKNQKIYVPSQNVQNIQVKVTSGGLRTTTSNQYVRCIASLYWCVADVNDNFPGTDIVGFSDGVPIYDIDLTQSIKFPNSPTIDSAAGGNTPLLNTEYTATIPQINVGEALYVFWHCQGTNQFINIWSGFAVLNMRISITQL